MPDATRRVAEEHRRDADGDHAPDEPAGEEPRRIAGEPAKLAPSLSPALLSACMRPSGISVRAASPAANSDPMAAASAAARNSTTTPRGPVITSALLLVHSEALRGTTTRIKLAHELPGSRVAQLRTRRGRWGACASDGATLGALSRSRTRPALHAGALALAAAGTARAVGRVAGGRLLAHALQAAARAALPAPSGGAQGDAHGGRARARADELDAAVAPGGSSGAAAAAASTERLQPLAPTPAAPSAAGAHASPPAPASLEETLARARPQDRLVRRRPAGRRPHRARRGRPGGRDAAGCGQRGASARHAERAAPRVELEPWRERIVARLAARGLDVDVE